MSTVEPASDGRRARRQRSREAVVSAAFELILEGKGPPSADDVAARAGVSVSSIFRNFDGLTDIQQQAHELFTKRYSHLLVAVPPLGSDFDSRVAFFVRTRLDLFGQAGALIAMARLRAVEDDTWREHIAANRSALYRQVRSCFEPEIGDRSPADAADVVSILDSITSPEAFDLMTNAHSRTPRQVGRAWTVAIRALLAGRAVTAGPGSTRPTLPPKPQP